MVDKVLELITDEVATDPPTFEVSVLVARDKILEIFKFETLRLEMVVVARVVVPCTIIVPVATTFPTVKLLIIAFTVSLLVEEELVEIKFVVLVVLAKIFVANKLVKIEVIAFRVLAKKLVEVPFVFTKLVTVALLKTGESVNE